MFKTIILVSFFALLLAFSLLYPKSRVILFWVSLMLFFDPGGFFAGYLEGGIIWRIKYYDIFFGFMLLAYILKGENSKLRWQSLSFIEITKYLLFISLYFLIITGFLVPLLLGYSNLLFFIQKNRQYFYALPLFIMTYRYSFTSIKIFYRVFIIFTVTILVSYMLTLLTPFKIIPVYTFSRYGEGDRISMISYGLIHWILPMGMIYLALGKGIKLPYGKYVLLAFVLMLITIFLTLTRREFLRIIFMAIIIPYLLSKINKSLYVNKYSKFLFPALGVILLLAAFFPNYIDLSVRLLNDTFHLVVSGKDTQGIEDYRITGSGDLRIVKDFIGENLLFGIGFYPAQWSDIVNMKLADNSMGLALDAAAEVPVYGALMTLGIVGLLVPFLFYWYLFILWRKFYRTLQINYNKFINYPLELLIIITLLYYLLAKVTIDAYGLFGEFCSPYGFTNFTIMLGMLLGIFQRFKLVFHRY